MGLQLNETINDQGHRQNGVKDQRPDGPAGDLYIGQQSMVPSMISNL